MYRSGGSALCCTVLLNFVSVLLALKYENLRDEKESCKVRKRRTKFTLLEISRPTKLVLDAPQRGPRCTCTQQRWEILPAKTGIKRRCTESSLPTELDPKLFLFSRSTEVAGLYISMNDEPCKNKSTHHGNRSRVCEGGKGNTINDYRTHAHICTPRPCSPSPLGRWCP